MAANLHCPVCRSRYRDSKLSRNRPYRCKTCQAEIIFPERGSRAFVMPSSEEGRANPDTELPLRNVQACISTIGFPEDVDGFEHMMDRYKRYRDPEFALNMDVILANRSGVINWTAPRWFMPGDIMFFYHSVRASKYTIFIRNKFRAKCDALLAEQQSNPKSRRPFYSALADIEKVSDKIFSRAVEQAQKFNGTIFAVGRACDVPESGDGGEDHWRSRVYCDISFISIFESPLPLGQFKAIANVTQNTITPLYQSSFTAIREKLAKFNALPMWLREATVGEIAFNEICLETYRSANQQMSTSFHSERQMREYFIDFLLEEIKDAGTTIYKECRCWRDEEPTGFADYFVRLGGNWLAVEAKLNADLEISLEEQLAQYTNIDRFEPTLDGSARLSVQAGKNTHVMVLDCFGLWIAAPEEWASFDNRAHITRAELLDFPPLKLRQLILDALNPQL